ncbi:MAG: DUF3422 family protein [Shimia sp.]
MPPIEDHPLRYRLANELHARPFPAMAAPSTGLFLAIKAGENASARDRDVDRAHLVALLDRYGVAHPSPGATHWYGQIGRHHLKWESHTEFVTYTVIDDGAGGRPFDPAAWDVFPDDWLREAPGMRLTSAAIRVEMGETEAEMIPKLEEWFVNESLAVAHVLDGSATVAGDFRIDPTGHMRFAVFVRPGTGQRRIGRILQRVCEIETYKSMSMLGFARAQSLGPKLTEMDGTLLSIVDDMAGDGAAAEGTLHRLLGISAELENISAKAAFRFAATRAYEAIVHERIQVLREERFGGRQTFDEFMARRYDPAMRTVKSTERRLATMADRAIRAGDLLRTRVDVERQGQNQALLESMDKRSDLQLRLQKTVEGLSVVAISYYALNLVVYALGPLGQQIGIGRAVFTAIATPVVILAVWALVRRIRHEVEK